MMFECHTECEPSEFEVGVYDNFGYLLVCIFNLQQAAFIVVVAKLAK